MPPVSSTASFHARYENLAEISSFVTRSAEIAGLDEVAIYAVQRAVDEACSNIIEHAYQGEEGGEIECLCIACDYGLIIRFHDYGKPFDPHKIPPPNLYANLTERPVGGLGLFFMRRFMDEVSFEFSTTSDGNTVTMVKYNDRHVHSNLWPQIIALAEQVISQPTLSAQFASIHDMAVRLFGGQAILWLTPEWIKASTSEVNNNVTLAQPTDLMNQAYEAKRQVNNESALSPTNLIQALQNETDGFSNYKYVAATPLITHGIVLGVIQIERSGHPFTQTEIKALDGLASQAAMALNATRQTEIERWRLEQLSLVRSVSSQIANVVDLYILAQRVTQLILESFKYYYAVIFTYQSGQDYLHFCASSGPLNPNLEQTPSQGKSLQVKLGSGMIGLAAATGVEYLSNDVRSDPNYEYDDTLPETLSEVAIPLKISSRVLGVLDIQSDLLDAFDETDMLVLRALADNTAIAVEGTRLFSALRHRADQITSVAEVSNAITSILNIDDLLNEVIRLIQERLGYHFIQIYSVNLILGDITYMASSSPHHSELHAYRTCYKLDDSEGLIPWAARNAATIISNDISQEPRFRPTGDFPVEIHSELVVPLVFGGQVQGILDIQSDRLNEFSDDDRSLFEALADNIAVAMRNAQLYRSEAWRRQVADSMHKVAGLLSADISISQLLDAILTELERALPCDAAAIWLVENGDNQEDNILPRFQLAAIHSRNVNLHQDEIEEALDEIPDSRTWLVEALQAELPLIRAHLPSPKVTETTDPFGSILGFSENYSAIAAPLRVGDTALGVLTLAHQALDRFGAESQAMTATFASYAAVAIENAKLYEAAHDQAWVSTVLLQVADATQSLTNIDELLATVVQITPLLVGVNACALMMWDDDAEAFVPGAAQGLTVEQQDDFEQWVVNPGDETAFDQLRVVKSPILLPHWSFAKPGNKESETEDNLLDIDNELVRPLILFPMVVQDTVLGGLLVDIAGTEFRDNEDRESEEFLHDEKLSVIQGIAHQTAIAVENIRLLKAQKEEAYVSVALLQVAQAVVSLIQLDEILETIVRIAPILVGVNRCAIYLWDEARGGFWLAQSYGVNHDVEELLTKRLYSPGEFPLLDIIFQHNKLIHLSLEEKPVQPSEWENLTLDELGFTLETTKNEEVVLQDSETETIADGQGFSVELLKYVGCLLYAFPLSVKGTVLGVFLAEEAPSPSEVPSYHVRQRRLEILTGITQQAALAIQNDRLQSEVVERERLEREMQLARSIQTTFLPQKMPTIPNWDLDMRWRTARQVGGDFYDLLELPNDKLGLVIADVADKGMPAALFMTLVRTLIRAAVHEEESPAAVLEEVNQLMIPDTQNGMFVTVIYAVLSLNTGEMVYTNAGHNLPLLLHTTSKEVHPLNKGGIALGILEDIHLEEHKITLEPGDCIIFYTDGVTEAFSPEDEMYGETRLHEIIRSACMDSASTVLDAIDHSVNEFIGDLPRADDLTMIAILRVGR